MARVPEAESLPMLAVPGVGALGGAEIHVVLGDDVRPGAVRAFVGVEGRVAIEGVAGGERPRGDHPAHRRGRLGARDGLDAA